MAQHKTCLKRKTLPRLIGPIAKVRAFGLFRRELPIDSGDVGKTRNDAENKLFLSVVAPRLSAHPNRSTQQKAINGTDTHTRFGIKTTLLFSCWATLRRRRCRWCCQRARRTTRADRRPAFPTPICRRWTETRQTATPRHQRPKSVASAAVVALAFRFSTHLGCFRRRFAPMFGIVGHVQFRSLPTTLVAQQKHTPPSYIFIGSQARFSHRPMRKRENLGPTRRGQRHACECNE